jgi:hypothetical protein
MGAFTPIRKLAADDEVKSFDCGQVDLNEWLSRYAYANQRSGMATVFVTTPQESKQVVGYYALATGGVEHSGAPARVVKGVPRHPIPVILLTRLAVDTSTQGQHLGIALLRDALIRVSGAADEVGVRALLIHAKDDAARSFYMAQAEFEPSPTDPLHLFLLMKDLRKAFPG